MPLKKKNCLKCGSYPKALPVCACGYKKRYCKGKYCPDKWQYECKWFKNYCVFLSQNCQIQYPYIEKDQCKCKKDCKSSPNDPEIGACGLCDPAGLGICKVFKNYCEYLKYNCDVCEMGIVAVW